MIWVLLGLCGAALAVAFWVWYRQQQRGYLLEMARRVRAYGAGTDPWEEPKIITTLGGIHDVEKDGWL